MTISFPIVDSHHHLWDLATCYYPWLSDRIRERRFGNYASIRRNYLPADYLADVDGLKLAGSVHVEASYGGADPVDETRWLVRQSAEHGVPTALVVHADLTDPAVEDVLARQVASGPVRALRSPLHWHPDPQITGIERPDLMKDPAWRRGLARLARFNLAFDLSIFHHQMEDALALARAFPEMTFVLNHCGLPLHLDRPGEEGGDERSAWEKGIKLLARAPNVTVKISGLWMAGRPLTVSEIRPVVRHLIACFGPDRAMFGSNFPVDRLHVKYRAMVAAYHACVSDLPEPDQRRIFAGTASRVYRLASGKAAR